MRNQMNDGRNTERRLFAIVLIIAILLAALIGCATGPWVPPALSKEFYRLEIRRRPFTENHPCARLSGRFVRWCWKNGYPDAVVVIFRKLGQRQTHAQVLIEIEGQLLYFDLTTGSIKPHGPEGWVHWRNAFKYEILNVEEWQ